MGGGGATFPDPFSFSRLRACHTTVVDAREAFADEAEFQSTVMTAARELGLLAYHPYRSEKSTPGFPDTTIIGHRGVLFRELKMEEGQLSPDQRYWLDALTEAGQNAAIWRPHHWPVIVLAEMRNLQRLQTPRPPMTQMAVRRALRGRKPRG